MRGEAGAAGDMNIFAWGIPAARLSFQLAEDPRSGESSLQIGGGGGWWGGAGMCMTNFTVDQRPNDDGLSSLWSDGLVLVRTLRFL